MKFALVSHVLPPSWSGQAMVIYRLLEKLDPALYCLISREEYGGQTDRPSYTAKLPGRYYPLRRSFRIRRGYRWGVRVVRHVANVLIAIVDRARQIAVIARREGCEGIIACTGDLVDPPAGFLASRLLGVPFFPYIFDHFSYREVDPLSRRIARRLEGLLLGGAECAIAPNEFLADELRGRFRAKVAIIRNPCDTSQFEGERRRDSDGKNGEIRIVYTGAVYEAHYDAFRNLVMALKLLGRRDISLHVYSAVAASTAAESGIEGSATWHEHVPLDSVYGVQESADFLFLPLAFNSPYPEVIRTSAPGKMGEYLAARRPILVHAPADSFIAWYFQRHKCGLVVDDGDPRKLAAAIERLLAEKDLRQELSSKAWMCACRDFDVRRVRAEFAKLMKLESGPLGSVQETRGAAG